MADAAVAFARGVSSLRTPDQLVPLRTQVRARHAGTLGAVHNALVGAFGADRGARHYGVETRQVRALSAEGETRNRRGVSREDIAAVAERDDTDSPG